MKRRIKALTAALAVLSSAFLSLTLYSAHRLPDSITTVKNDIVINGMYYASIGDVDVQAVSDSTAQPADTSYDVNFSLFGLIPVKTVNVTKTQRSHVIPGGGIVGIRLQSDGVMIVSIQSFESEGGTASPAESAGLLKGDIICSIDGKAITGNVSLVDTINSGQGKTMEFTVLRNDERISVNVTPQRCLQNGKYKCGLWVRDSAAGIGTLSFFCPETGVFACLGHSVTDADTGLPVPLFDGELLSAGIIGIKKGSSGAAGELSGVLGGEILGELLMNNSTGVYGRLNAAPRGDSLPLACCSEVHKGYAQVLTSIDSNPPKLYDAQIISVAAELDAKEKNFVIEITDTELLAATGGIVQGMSGSPIIQDGMFAGAVTHVFLNEPKRGYGIFAEHMYESALRAASMTSSQDKAA